MKVRLFAVGLALIIGLSVPGRSQEAALSFAAGGFFATEAAYREIYGTGVPLALEIWLKAKGPFGLAAGLSWLKDDGLALTEGEGETEYPVEFRMRTIPLVAFFQLDVKSVRIRLGAGIGIHRYEEVWPTSTPAFEGNKVSPRFMISANAGLIGRLSLIGTLIYQSVPTGAGSVLVSDVNLGGFQLLGGLSYRIF